VLLLQPCCADARVSLRAAQRHPSLTPPSSPLTWKLLAVPLRLMPTVSVQGLLSVSMSAVAALMASTRGLQRRTDVSASRASGSCQPLSQYM